MTEKSKSMNPNVCLFNKFGYCKFNQTCHKKHEETVCNKDMCEIEKCPFRHPKVCKYFVSQGYCKFGQYCRFRHFNENQEYVDSINEMVKEIKNLKAVIEAKELEIKNLEIKVCSEKRNTEKIEQTLKNLKMRSFNVKKKMSAKNIKPKKNIPMIQQSIELQKNLPVPAPTPQPPDYLSLSIDKKSLNF